MCTGPVMRSPLFPLFCIFMLCPRSGLQYYIPSLFMIKVRHLQALKLSVPFPMLQTRDFVVFVFKEPNLDLQSERLLKNKFR